MKPMAATWRLAAAAVVAGLLVILVLNAITQPVTSQLHSYTADFTDVAGLHVDADVRIRGVRVGKVTTVELRRSAGHSIVQVGFTLDNRYSIGTATKLAIKYQALTGLRYVDVLNASDGTPAAKPLTHIPTSMTQPSFDITGLFNGLEPVLATLSPDDLNTFAANVDTFLSGDGSGLGPVLKSIHTLTEFLGDRQQVVERLMDNLRTIADAMGGHAKDLIKIIDGVNITIDASLNVLDEFRKSQLYGPEFSRAVIGLLNSAGIKSGDDFDAALDKAFTNVDDTISAIKLVPAIWDNIPPPAQAGHPLECSKGRAELPLPVDVLLNGQRVLLCKQ